MQRDAGEPERGHAPAERGIISRYRVRASREARRDFAVSTPGFRGSTGCMRGIQTTFRAMRGMLRGNPWRVSHEAWPCFPGIHATLPTKHGHASRYPCHASHEAWPCFPGIHATLPTKHGDASRVSMPCFPGSMVGLRGVEIVLPQSMVWMARI